MPMVGNGGRAAAVPPPVMAPEPARAAPVLLARAGSSDLANVTPLVPSLLLHEPEATAGGPGADNDSDKSIGEQQDKDIPEEIVVQPSRIVFKDSTAKKEDWIWWSTCVLSELKLITL